MQEWVRLPRRLTGDNDAVMEQVDDVGKHGDVVITYNFVSRAKPSVVALVYATWLETCILLCARSVE